MTDRGGRRRRRPRAGRATVLAIAAVLVVAGCTPPGLPAPIAPATSSVHGSIPAAEPRVTIGVDGAVVGFNPHAIADYSLADAAVADLVLPSVSSVTTDGSVVLDTDVVQKAEVTSVDPFTVTYTVDRNASWSDGTPITAEDFSYLWSAMQLQPGTVDPAGYRLITSITSRDAGKTVEVRFARALLDWQTLFSPLLPSHILKDSPGGWTEGLAAGIPVSGNRYKMQGYDAVTGEITLVRNDKYWGRQPGPSIAVLRIGTSSALIEALGRGDLQAVFLQPDAADQRRLEAVVPAADRVPVPLPGTVQLIFNTAGGPTAQLAVRRAIAVGLDPEALRAALTGGNAAGGAAAPSLVQLPAAPVGRAGTTGQPAGSTPADTGRPTGTATNSSTAGSQPAGSTTIGSTAGTGVGDPGEAGAPGSTAGGNAGRAAAAEAELAAAGYHRGSLYVRKAGSILRLTLAYSAQDARIAVAARLVQSELAAAGIEVDLVRDQARAVVDTRLALGTVDLGLVLVPRGTSNGISAASAFGCPPPVPAGRPTATAPAPRSGNLSGFCSAELQSRIDGSMGAPMSTDLDQLLQQQAPVLQLSRPSAVFATAPELAPLLSDSGPGWIYSGPLAGLPRWPYG